jgi:O-antigen biosynthesis protein WbqP
MNLKTELETSRNSATRPSLALKRTTDIVLSGGVLLCFGWLVLLMAAIAIKLDSPGPILFRQKRVGRNGELFEILKFRSMRVDAPNVATDVLLKMGVNPITRVGGILRKTSIDELPQLINVLRGDMSLVGPRPALFNQYELTEKRLAADALWMPPGITGWAQVNGRDELADDEKVAYDAWYCKNWNYWLDWAILFRTVFALINRRGVN